MLRINKSQMEHFERVALQSFCRKMASRLSGLEKRFGRDPEHTAKLAVQFCEAVGLKGQDAMMGCGLLMMAYGPEQFVKRADTVRIRDNTLPEFVRKTEIHKRLVELDSQKHV